MRRFDLEEDGTAIVMGETDKLPQDDTVKRMLGIVSQIVNPPLIWINQQFSKFLKEEVHAVHIMFRLKDMRACGMTITSDKTAHAIEILEKALVQLREAQKKEQN